jgi:predicted transcriptional regulator
MCDLCTQNRVLFLALLWQRTMTIETNNIVNNLAPAWLQDILNVKKNLNIYSYIIIFWKFHVWKLHIVVRIVLSLLLLHWGTVFCTISGLKIVSPNSRVLCNPVMCQKVSIPHVGKLLSLHFILFLSFIYVVRMM